MSSILEQLAQNQTYKNVRQERQRLVEKWSKTKLLNGLSEKNQARSNIAQLLENQCAAQAKSLLAEASTDSMIKGFQNVAFPLVRRIFGGLIANEIVSVQPMSLPAGLLFYLDYTYGTNKAGNGRLDWTAGGYVHGDVVSPGVSSLATGGPYYLNTGYSARELTGAVPVVASGTATWDQVSYDFELSGAVATSTLFYVDLSLTGGSTNPFTLAQIDATNYKQFAFSGSETQWATVNNIFKRYNTFNSTTGVARIFYSGSQPIGTNVGVTASVVIGAGMTVDSTGVVLTPAFESNFATDMIPEININVQSVAVTANTRKLKVKWTPELAQDLQAYQNLDAEVELTQIMSEQIAIDIDREILTNLLSDGSAAVMYWSRKPGNFVNKLTGLDVVGSFTGDTIQWYHTLLETINDLANTIHRKTLRSKANFLVVSPDVATVLESMVPWKPASLGDPLMNRFAMGIEKVGSLNSMYTVYKDPYFPRNVILVGYKGNTFLDSGFVYAPYVPLIVTPTIYSPDDFTPRRGIMTRYGKKMVRSDFYGKIIIKSMDVI